MLSNNLASIDEKWTKIDSNEGVVCYERKLIRSYYLEHRANAVIDCPMEEVFSILRDISAFPKWIYNCTEALLLEDRDDFNKVIYYVQGSSLNKWDSDIILSVRTLIDLNSDKIIINLKSLDNHTYQHPDIETHLNRTRMTGFKGSWRLEVNGSTSTMVSFTVHANPGKVAGEYLVNNLMQNICFISLQNLIQTVERKAIANQKKTQNQHRKLFETLARSK